MRSAPNFWLPAFVGLAMAAGWGDGASRGDEIFVLKNGGQVRGQWLNRNESPRETYAIRTSSGGEVTLDSAQVVKVALLSEDEMLYEKLRPTHADTVEGHSKLANWCQEKGLVEQRKTHLGRILELDPNHAEARAALGFQRVNGEWSTRTDLMANRGMILYKGRYRTRQEIEIWEEERKGELAEREWATKIKRFRGWLETDKMGQARLAMQEINDPAAVPALASYLQKDEPRNIKLLMIETLEHIPSHGALQVLVMSSLQDPDQEVRLSAQDAVVRSENHDAVNMYIAALKSKDNLEINRAARALQDLGDEAAIEPLFDALVTEHKYKVVTKPAGQMTSTFRPGGGGGMSFGGDGPKLVVNQMQNRDVLNALIILTKQNYHYDAAEWKRWYASRQRASKVNARRD